MLLVGWRGAGKSSAGNLLLGCRVFESGHPTEVSVRRQALVAGRHLTVVDTPGWDWFSVQRTPSNIRREIKLGAGLLHPGATCALMVIPVVSTLTPKRDGPLKANLEMFGEEACQHTLVLFSCGDLLYGTSIEDHIQRDGGELLKLMQHCWKLLPCAGTVPKPTRTSHRLLNSAENRGDGSREWTETFLTSQM